MLLLFDGGKERFKDTALGFVVPLWVLVLCVGSHRLEKMEKKENEPLNVGGGGGGGGGGGPESPFKPPESCDIDVSLDGMPNGSVKIVPEAAGHDPSCPRTRWVVVLSIGNVDEMCSIWPGASTILARRRSYSALISSHLDASN